MDEHNFIQSMKKKCSQWWPCRLVEWSGVGIAHCSPGVTTPHIFIALCVGGY